MAILALVFLKVSMQQIRQIIVVLEVSSFQLERCKRICRHHCDMTNIHANHLDRHGSMEEYINAKLQCIVFAKKRGIKLFSYLTLFNQIPESIRNARPLHFFTVMNH